MKKFQKADTGKKVDLKAQKEDAHKRGASVLMMGGNIPKDQLVWYRNPDQNEQDENNSNKPLYLCYVVELKGDKVVLKLVEEEVSQCKLPQLTVQKFEVPVNSTLDYSLTSGKGLPDMVEIDELNHATLMHNLCSRYLKDEIYTYVGPIILAMNPFKSLDKSLYGDQQLTMYKSIIQSKTPYEDKKNFPPHIWTITALAYRQMMELKTRQAIVISGESGSGKTENAKRSMKFLTGLGGHKVVLKENEVPIEQKILNTNVVLEAFGNSKTVRNNNSSRFGKYVLLYFTQNKGEILGARVKNYLLEKSRVVNPGPGERNYHVFYHLLRGADEELLNTLGLMDPSKKKWVDIHGFNFLKSGADQDVDQKIVNDIELYEELADRFNSLGFSKDEQLAIWKVTAACLHLGEIVFDDSTFDENGKPCTIQNMDKMNLIAKLLGFEQPLELVSEIVNKNKNADVKARVPYKKAECLDSRDSLAKCLYDNLFNWLVERMNLTILPESEADANFKKDTQTVGLLDIFGFECFAENNFEQMCINYVNEKLNKLYISAIFDAEKFEFKTEGLQEKMKDLNLPDLTSLFVIKLLDERPGAAVKGSKVETKMGLFTIVNDCSTQKPRPKWDALMKRFETEQKNTPYFIKEKQDGKFKIRHSAKEVVYTLKTFIERNVDEISTSLEAIIITKADPIISKIFQGVVKESNNGKSEEEKKKDKGATKKTIWSKFQAQMMDLMNELAEPLFDLNKDEESKEGAPKKDAPCENTQLHFIRCIKPNEAKKPDLFIHAMTLQQITYMGVLESVDLKQKNFPFRKNYEEFYSRFELLSPLYGTCRYENMNKGSYDFRQLSQNIVKDVLKDFGIDLYAIGLTKVFMMPQIVALLERAMQKVRVTRDNASIQIKRAFSLYQGLLNANRKHQIFLKFQKKLKIKCLARVEQRGQQMFNKVMLQVSKSVTKKKDEMEISATQVLVDVYRKHIFRRAMARRVKVRKTIVNFIYKWRLITRLRKIYICYMMTREIAEISFLIAKKKADDRAIRTVQRIFRGFTVRQQRMPLVMNAMMAKENLKLHVAAKIVQKRLRGFVVRNRLTHLNRMAQKVQGFVKMKWHRQFYLKLRGDVMTIQRNVRRFLTRRGVIKQRLVSFLSHEVNALEKVKRQEQHKLKHSSESHSNNEQYLKPPIPYSVKKLQFFTRILDLHVLTDLSEVYPGGWANQWNKVNGDCTAEDSPLLYVANGSTHSIAVNQKGRVFAWGWNDNGQCAKPQEILELVAKSAKNAYIHLQKEDLRIKQVVTAQDRVFILLEESQKVIVWGGNEKGQLGLGTYEDEFSPKLLDFFIKQNIKVNMLAAGGDLTLCTCENGEAYAWPFQRGGTTYSLPVKMPFSSKVKISSVSCGFNFGFFISSQGLVYSHGKDNSEGQLGLGHIYPRDAPELITSLKDTGERIETVECGYKHVISKSSLGKVYIWGWGARGQLGLGHLDSEMSPRQLVFERKGQKERVIQIAAGFSHSVVMLERNRDLNWFGTCGHLTVAVNKPTHIKLSDHMPELFQDASTMTQQVDFAVVKITSSWSRSMSLTNVLVADLRQVNNLHPWKKIGTSMQTIATKWQPRDVLPPYIDTVSGLFNASMLKLPNTSSFSSGGHINQKVAPKRNVTSRMTSSMQSSRGM